MAGVGFVLADWLSLLLTCCFYASVPWHFLYFFPEPHGQGSLRPTFSPVRRGAAPLVSAVAVLTERACSSSRCFFLWNSRSRASIVVDGGRLDTGEGTGWRAAGALVCCGGTPGGKRLAGLAAASSCWNCASAAAAATWA